MRIELLVLAIAFALIPGVGRAQLYAVEERSLAAVAADLQAGRVSAEAVTRAYLDRIAAIDPQLRSVLAVNPRALEQARALDVELRAGRSRGPLHGVPVLVKDNIETADQPTTAGSLALAANAAGRDAPLVARLRAAGAVILGKTNLSEWANIRSSESVSGWSAVGGQTRNPYALDRNPCGSSSGSGVAAAASLAAATVGTETDGSIVCPASANGVVGLKPTVGLVSRTHVVPISATQDTPGPMTRTVEDAALLLTVLAGSDPADPATAEADRRRVDYSRALKADALRGRRLGVLRFQAGFDSEVSVVFDRALADLKAAGAEIVDIDAPGVDLGKMGEQELAILLFELKRDLNAYLATTPAAVRTRTLADVIAFNNANPDAETPLFGQDLFLRAQAGEGADAYPEQKAAARKAAGPDGIDAILAKHKVDALIAPTLGPAWLIDPVNGDQYVGSGVSQMPAVAGYPHITVPMGQVRGLPVGLSFVAEAWSEAKLLGLAYAYEQRSRARRPPRYLPTITVAP
jgi:amidase